MSLYDHTLLRVYQHAFELAIEIQRLTAQFPAAEQYRMTDQIIQCSRSPCPSIAEAWRKRRYTPQFINKILDAEGEAAETRVWLQFADRLNYIEHDVFTRFDSEYNRLLVELVHTRMTARKWANFQPREAATVGKSRERSR